MTEVKRWSLESRPPRSPLLQTDTRDLEMVHERERERERELLREAVQLTKFKCRSSREEFRECEGDREVRFYESKVTSLLSMEARHKVLAYSQGPQIMKHCS